VWRISGETAPHKFSTADIPTYGPDHPCTDGTLRLQAPELMAGGDSKFLASMDTYAFAICCIEILTMGGLPWPLLDDDTVRHLVLSTFLLSHDFWRSLTSGHPLSAGENKRPDIPNNHRWTKEIARIIEKFFKIIAGLGVIGKKYNISLQHIPPDCEMTPRVPPGMSPDMRLVHNLPIIPPCEHGPDLSCVAGSNIPAVGGEESQEEPGTDSSPEIPTGISQSGSTTRTWAAVTKAIREALLWPPPHRYLARAVNGMITPALKWIHLHLWMRCSRISRVNDATGCYSNMSSTCHVC